jgi:hypothetical protein
MRELLEEIFLEPRFVRHGPTSWSHFPSITCIDRISPLRLRTERP